MDFISKSDWIRFCDQFSRSLEGLRAEVEIGSLDLGNQIEAKSLPILGLSYDHKDDVFVVALEGIEHLIRAPQELHAEISAGGISAIAIKDAEGIRHLIKLTHPLALPAAQASAEQNS